MSNGETSMTDMGMQGKLQVTAEKHTFLNASELGMTTACACQYDQRFSYCMYVPRQFQIKDATRFRLLVAIHGTNRLNQRLLERFRSFADEYDFIVLAPLFPARITDPEDMDNFKYLLYKDIRFDLVLVSMIDEIRSRYRLASSKFSLFGFSGGAHFVHRFLFLYPELINSVSIAAPGSITKIDSSYDWWVGTANVEHLFGKTIDFEALKKVDTHLVVGADDTNTDEINHSPGSKHWMTGADKIGRNRVDRLKALSSNLQSHGVNTELEILPNVGHEEGPLVVAAIEKLRQLL